jgi:hypothetical protein
MRKPTEEMAGTPGSDPIALAAEPVFAAEVAYGQGEAKYTHS